MSGLEHVYAPPEQDADEQEAAEADAEGAPAQWYAIPIWRLFLFSLLGGNLYQLHYMYRAWQAHRASFGYSAHERWIARYEATGFRVSPFWRAALVIYSYSWLLVVDREARRAKLTGFGPVWPWFALQLLASLVLPPWAHILGVAVVFVPAQTTVNRLHDKATGTRVREPVTATELCWLVIGTLATFFAYQRGGLR